MGYECRAYSQYNDDIDRAIEKDEDDQDKKNPKDDDGKHQATPKDDNDENKAVPRMQKLIMQMDSGRSGLSSDRGSQIIVDFILS